MPAFVELYGPIGSGLAANLRLSSQRRDNAEAVTDLLEDAHGL